MQEISFFNWKVYLQDNLVAVTDIPSKKMVIMESALNLNAVIWIDGDEEVQIKPTWDCVISINSKDKALTIRHVDDVFYNNEDDN
ncbi:hypothetical protein [Priestia filamentosa]|uniref:hypothetical protein n=1 Tax=Priestia TaxID=2800373 RepID=UPI000302B16B|nr:hypothetical protein [Priestia filamentosa]